MVFPEYAARYKKDMASEREALGSVGFVDDADFDDMVMAALPLLPSGSTDRPPVLGAAAVDAAMGDIEPTPTHFSIGPPLSTAGPKNAAAWCPD